MKCENTSVMLSIKPIAYIHSDFSEKFGIPRQSGLVDSLQAKIIFTEEFRNGNKSDIFDLKIVLVWDARACLKNHSSNLHTPICGIFCLHSVAVAHYAALIQAKSPANCDAHLAESIFQTRSRIRHYKYIKEG